MALGILNGQLFIRFNGNNEKLSEYLLTFAGSARQPERRPCWPPGASPPHSSCWRQRSWPLPFSCGGLFRYREGYRVGTFPVNKERVLCRESGKAIELYFKAQQRPLVDNRVKSVTWTGDAYLEG